MIALLLAAEERIDQTHNSILPEGYEIWFAGSASIIVFALLFWKLGPVVKKAMHARTQRIQDELDASAKDESDAVAEAARIRQAKGDIESERARLLAEADERAEALLADGRARLEREVSDLEAKATADIAAAGSRSSDELRGEIVGLAATTAERVVVESLDDATHQRLIEDFIANVGRTGATAGAGS
jgi:F-type H+-transporting ATPase subunit b